MKQLEVQIMGQSYLLGCPEGGDSRLLEAVERVDTAMCKIRDAGKVRARDRIAVLAALNLAFDLTELPRTSLPAPAATGTPDSGGTGTESAAASSASLGALDDLIARLDRALGQDGRLI